MSTAPNEERTTLASQALVMLEKGLAQQDQNELRDIVQGEVVVLRELVVLETPGHAEANLGEVPGIGRGLVNFLEGELERSKGASLNTSIIA